MYPQHGEYRKAEHSKSDVLVFFVHFFEGNKKLLSKHIQLVNQLGFDTYAFNMDDKIKGLLHPPVASNGKFGIKHVLAEQIETHLNLFPQKKLVFAFSNPCASAIEAIANRNCSDIVGLICDSGPSGKFFESAINLFVKEQSIRAKWYRNPLLKSKLAKWLAVPGFTTLWSPLLHKDVHADLAKFPENFPVLSIRGGKDALIPPLHIDLIFDPHSKLDLQNLNLPEVHHLQGLKAEPEIYTRALKKFLHQFEK